MLIAIAIVYAVIAALLFAFFAFQLGAAYMFDGADSLWLMMAGLAVVASVLWPLTFLWFGGGWLYRKIAGID